MDKKLAVETVTEIAQHIAENRGAINESMVMQHVSSYSNWRPACDVLTKQEVSDAIGDGIVNASLAEEKNYAFATDSEHGYLIADNFGEACELLREMLPGSAVDDGGWGWVEDTDGERYTIGKCS